MDPVKHLETSLAGRYQIEKQIGAGGMATVYLARDLKHNRRVALKVLRPELAAVLGPDRFLSEINVTANLQHPNLLPLFDSGEAAGLLYYVMPYIEGETLRTRLDRDRQLPVELAVRFAVAIAGALDHAHRHDVIHRDLKPENILIHEGQPLIMDFGIALAVSNAGGARVTQTGLSLGTPQYMSPEQATGDRHLDARSDIYSLGAVLYEMLTGDPPHTGSTVQAIIAKVLTDRPQSVRVYRDTVPEHVDRALQCALAKLPADRFETAGEFADALTGTRAVALPTYAHTIATFEAVPMNAAAVRKRRIKAAVPWAIAGIAALSAVMIGLSKEDIPRGYPTIFELTLPDSVSIVSTGGVTVALSRDGSKLAFVGEVGNVGGILLRRMNELNAQLVRGTENGARPSFSPDGNWLLFAVGGELKKVPVGGGAPIVLADSVGTPSDWGDGDQILYERAATLWRVSSEGGDAALLLTRDTARGHVRYSWPHILPGGKAALITIFKGSVNIDGAHLGVVSLEDGEVTELGVIGSNPRYVHTGHIVFGRMDGSLFAAPFSARRLRLTGPIEPILEQVQVKNGGAVEIAISTNGTLVYKTGATPSRRVVTVDLSGRAQPLIHVEGSYHYPRVAPSGRRIAVSVGPQPNADIWTYELGSGTLTRLTTSEGGSRPEWTPDGHAVAYVLALPQKRELWVQPWDGSGVPEMFIGMDSLGTNELSYGPPGTYNAYRRGSSPTDMDIWIAPSDSPRAMRPFLSNAWVEKMPRVSPDGRLLAYVSDESGREEVFVRPLPGPGARVQVSISGGTEPVWMPDGKSLLYRTPRALTRAGLERSSELAVTRRDSLFADRFTRSTTTSAHHYYDVFPDGTKLVMIEPVDSRIATYAVTSWSETLRKNSRRR